MLNANSGPKLPWAKLSSINSSTLVKSDLLGDRFQIGRVEGNDLVIRDGRLSAHHCSITRNDNSVILTDLSRNGTFRNNELVSDIRYFC